MCHLGAMNLEAFAKSLPYGACPRDEIATAGQPTAAQLADAAREGIKTIIDLRAANEPRGYDEAAAVEAAGMEYVLIPVTPVSLNDAAFDKFLALMRDATRRPVLVHCASANRVGGLLLPYFLLDEKLSEPAALKLAQQVGLRSPEYAQMAVDYARRHAVPK
jgi:uncharacterized protein (TIGR01244 family)